MPRRPGLSEELYELRWTDIDLDAEEARVRRAFDVRAKEETATKTRAGERDVPIPPSLMPLLRLMHEERGSDRDLVVARGSRKSIEGNADLSRRYLRIAGVDRAALFDGETQHKPFDLRSWRTTGLTWLGMLGTDSYEAGHEKPDITWASHVSSNRSDDDTFKSHTFSRHGRCDATARCESRRTTRRGKRAQCASFLAERAGFEPAVGF